MATMLGCAPTCRLDVPVLVDTLTPTAAPPELQLMVDMIRKELEGKTKQQYSQFVATQYVKQSKNIVVKVNLH